MAVDFVAIREYFDVAADGLRDEGGHIDAVIKTDVFEDVFLGLGQLDGDSRCSGFVLGGIVKSLDILVDDFVDWGIEIYVLLHDCLLVGLWVGTLAFFIASHLKRYRLFDIEHLDLLPSNRLGMNLLLRRDVLPLTKKAASFLPKYLTRIALIYSLALRFLNI